MSNKNTSDTTEKLYSVDQLTKMLEFAPYQDLIRCITNEKDVYSVEYIRGSLKENLGKEV